LLVFCIMMIGDMMGFWMDFFGILLEARR
jgi:hypothetical protein